MDAGCMDPGCGPPRGGFGRPPPRGMAVCMPAGGCMDPGCMDVGCIPVSSGGVTEEPWLDPLGFELR